MHALGTPTVMGSVTMSSAAIDVLSDRLNFLCFSIHNPQIKLYRLVTLLFVPLPL